jgi:hypothetical protein
MVLASPPPHLGATKAGRNHLNNVKISKNSSNYWKAEEADFCVVKALKLILWNIKK